MVLAIIDAFYDETNNFKLCARVTKIDYHDVFQPCVTQYCISTTHPLEHVISAIKARIPIELDNLYVSIDSHGLNCAIEDELKQCGYKVLPLEIIPIRDLLS